VIGQYCKVVGCAAAGGTCTTRPVNQPPAFVPQCGCDNVTYWNETIAGVYGANVKAPGTCPTNTAATCKPGVAAAKCATNRSCNVDTTQCGVPLVSGYCWGLPTVCPGEATQRACGGGIGFSGPCLSYCEAVRNEKVFSKDTNNCP
jgi:hypothetical protein